MKKIAIMVGAIFFVASLFLVSFANAESASAPVLLWKYTLPSFSMGYSPMLETPEFESPAVGGSVVYVGTDSQGGPYEGLYALDATSGSQLWSYSPTVYNGGSGAVESTPNVVNGVVYFGSDDGNVYALNAANGACIWNYTTGNFVDSCPAVVGGVVYIGSGDGNAYALNATDGALLWNTIIGSGFVYSCPNIVNGAIYVTSSSGFVYALNATNGVKMWYYDTGADISSAPIVVGQNVFVGNRDSLSSLDASNGQKIWSDSFSRGFSSTPAVANGVVYAGGNSPQGDIYALDAASGAQIWNYTTGGPVESSPIIANGVLYVGSGNLYALNAMTGTNLWNYTIGTVDSCPAVDDGVLYVGCSDGNLYALGSLPITSSSAIPSPNPILSSSSTPAIIQTATPFSTSLPSPVNEFEPTGGFVAVTIVVTLVSISVGLLLYNKKIPIVESVTSKFLSN